MRVKLIPKMFIPQIDITVTNVLDIVADLLNAFEDDKYPWDATLYARAALEIQTLRSLAEDMYVTLVNEIGETSATKNYELYLGTINVS